MSICIDKHITHRLTEMPLNLAYLVATSLASSAIQKKAEVSEQTHSMLKKKSYTSTVHAFYLHCSKFIYPYFRYILEAFLEHSGLELG